MKHLILALAITLGFNANLDAQTVASVDLKNLEGMSVNPSDLVVESIVIRTSITIEDSKQK